jgi:hypothetical protein
MLCLINAYCTRTNISPQDTHTHVTFRVELERPKRPLATDSWITVRTHDWSASASRLRVRTRGLTFGSSLWLFFPLALPAMVVAVGRLGLVCPCCVLAGFFVVLHGPFARRGVPFDL